MSALHYRTLAETAADIGSGALTAEQVTRHTLERIAALEPRLHAYAHVRSDAALAEARAADKRRAEGQPLGALHGVPVAVKDLCAIAGTPTRAGGIFDTHFKPDDTATVVSRLQAAGAIVVGKAQLTEGAWGSHHPTIPAPLNPWAPERWSGSSSSGSGVSVAAGLAYGAIGTDTAGSIRFPSACNGLVGLKPSWGRVSRHGVFPLSDTFDHVGPMARTVLDAALMFDCIAGPDPRDPTTLAGPVESTADAARAANLRGVRVGLDVAYALENVDAITVDAMTRTIALLKDAGAEIVEVKIPDVHAQLVNATASALVEAAISHAANYPAHKETYSRSYAALLDTGRTTSVLDYARIAIWRREFAGALRVLFAGVDCLIAPVLPSEAPTLDMMAAMTEAPPLSAAPLMAYTLPFNLAGVPTLTLPMGRTPSGMPIGFQLIGPDRGEAQLMRAGAGYEKALGPQGHPAL